MLILIDRPLINARNLRAAATQLYDVDGNNALMVHNNRSVIEITLGGPGGSTRRCGNGVQAIQDGAKVGQLLYIEVVDAGINNDFFQIDNNAATSKTILNGNWKSGDIGEATVLGGWLLVRWDGTYWRELDRYDGLGWTATGQWAHGEGRDGTASGPVSHIEGRGCTASSANSHAEGWATVANGSEAHAEGLLSIANGEQSHASGKYGVADQIQQFAQGGNRFTSSGDIQYSRFVCSRAVTHSDTNWYTIGIEKTDTGPVIAADTAWTFEVQVVGATVDMGKVFSYLVNGTIDRIGDTTTLRASNVTTLYETDADFDCQAVADDTGETLAIQVKDSTFGGDAVRWVATIKLTQIMFT